jgi:hypothetical protein
MVTVLLLLFLFQQAPADHSTAKKPKASYERTPFTRNGTACGTLMELKSGQWRAVVGNIASQPFQTRQEAAMWLKLYCPTEGKK